MDYALGLEEEDIDDTPTTRSDQGGKARGNGMVGKRVEVVVTRSGHVVLVRRYCQMEVQRPRASAQE